MPGDNPEFTIARALWEAGPLTHEELKRRTGLLINVIRPTLNRWVDVGYAEVDRAQPFDHYALTELGKERFGF